MQEFLTNVMFWLLVVILVLTPLVIGVRGVFSCIVGGVLLFGGSATGNSNRKQRDLEISDSGN